MRCSLENRVLLQPHDVMREIADDFAPGIERAFALTPAERCYPIDQVEGNVPSFVQGSYYLNGPARFVRGGFHYRHWLDGDGMVCSLRFEDGRIEFANRFIRSEKFAAEEQAGRPIFRTFGTTFPSDRLKCGVALESAVNVSIYPYNGSLLAFGEQGLPWELDPVTLETCGKFTFGGYLNDLSPFAAHPKFDPTTGEMFNFGVAFSPRQPMLNLYRFDHAGNQIYRKRHPLPFACSVHDFSVSARYAVFYLNPYIVNMEALLRDGCSLMDSLDWEPERGCWLLVISRERGERVALVPLGGRYCLHQINCFDEGENLTVDVVELERPIYDQYQIFNLFTDVAEGHPVRLVLEPKSGHLSASHRIDYKLAPDFPTTDPRRVTQPYRDFWMLGISETGRSGRKFFDQLVHADWTKKGPQDVYQSPPMQYLGAEPIFVPNPRAERAGVVICQVFDAASMTSAFALFDALAVAKGPIATLRLKAPIHFGFHASFSRLGRGLRLLGS